jgi:hypothetical protein
MMPIKLNIEVLSAIAACESRTLAYDKGCNNVSVRVAIAAILR